MHIGITSGHFNPLHEGALALLRDAKSKCDILVVIVNSDEQVLKRGSCPFLDEKFRADLISELKCVDSVRIAIDKDGTVTETLKSIVNGYTATYRILDTISGKPLQELSFSFFKGGNDRSKLSELPDSEVQIAKDLGVTIRFGIGGFNKANSSSTALSNAFKWYLGQISKMDYKEKREYLKKLGYYGEIYNYDEV